MILFFLGCSEEAYTMKKDSDYSQFVYKIKNRSIWSPQTGNEVKTGIFSHHNLLKRLPKPTTFAKQNIIKDSAINTFSLLINSLFEHIYKLQRNRGSVYACRLLKKYTNDLELYLPKLCLLKGS